MRRLFRLARTLLVAALLISWGGVALFRSIADRPKPATGEPVRRSSAPVVPAETPMPVAEGDGVKVGTFLGGAQRRSYGLGPAPKELRLVWKARIGQGWTNRKADGKRVLWSGTGWTGQPTLVREGGRDWLVIGGYDHKLRRIDADTGETTWAYAFDDVIKGTNSVVEVDDGAGGARLLVVSGSRRGVDTRPGDPSISPLRAIDFASGREVWRSPVPMTDNYSQDVDASPLLVGKTLYAAVEPGYVLGLDPLVTEAWGGHRRPKQLARSPILHTPADARAHPDIGGANVAVEGSPAVLGDIMYVASGSGHIWGLKLPGLKPVWDFRVGSDIDSTPAVTKRGKLLVGIERQYISGHGGVYMLDPAKPPKDAPVWYFDTPDRGIGEWKGGVVGSVAINDEYAKPSEPALAAFNGVDGGFYVVSQDETDGTTQGPRNDGRLPKPKLVFRDSIGGGIATPAFVGGSIVTCGYDNKVRLYRLKFGPKGTGEGVDLKCADGVVRRVSVRLADTFSGGGPFESTPLVWQGRVFIGCRDGWLYCLGD